MKIVVACLISVGVVAGFFILTLRSANSENLRLGQRIIDLRTSEDVLNKRILDLQAENARFKKLADTQFKEVLALKAELREAQTQAAKAATPQVKIEMPMSTPLVETVPAAAPDPVKTVTTVKTVPLKELTEEEREGLRAKITEIQEQISKLRAEAKQLMKDQKIANAEGRSASHSAHADLRLREAKELEEQLAKLKHIVDD
jgi:tetrahydromethanopterin S-methyltransferase subunit B